MDLDVIQRESDYEIRYQGETLPLDCVALTSHSYSVILNGHSLYIQITGQGDDVQVTVDQRTDRVLVKDETQLLLEKFGINKGTSKTLGDVSAPIPGLVTRSFIEVDQEVKSGDQILILEAMKMENEITTPLDGIVGAIHYQVGQAVEKGELLVEIIPKD